LKSKHNAIQKRSLLTQFNKTMTPNHVDMLNAYFMTP